MSDAALTLTKADVSRATCPCCGGQIITAQGDVDQGDTFVAWYTARWGDRHRDGPIRIRSHFGDWSDIAPNDTRWAVHVDHYDGKGHKVLDWLPQAASPPRFTALNRADITGAPFEATVATVIDIILTRDTRLTGALS